MKAVVARDRAAGVDGLALGEMPYPHAAENDVIVRVHAAGFTPGELEWPGTWTDRAGRDRAPTIPGHEVAGVVAELGTAPPVWLSVNGSSGLPTGAVTARLPTSSLWKRATLRRFRLVSIPSWLLRCRFQALPHCRDCSPTVSSRQGRRF